MMKNINILSRDNIHLLEIEPEVLQMSSNIKEIMLNLQMI